MTSESESDKNSGDNPTKGMPAQDHTVILEAPRELGCYRLTRMLGRGGMGEVWQAFDTQLERDVAIKLMRKELVSNEDATRRFAREARAVARLNHPNIVHVYSFGDEKGITYFVMEMVEGETVTQRLKRSGKLPLDAALSITMQAIEGLSYANARGIIHRDIKPSNLMLAENSKVKIADFGLAKMVEHDTQMTAAGTAMGSPNYMSPEQARGEEADHRSDIYALGITLYQMLCNCLPFTAHSPVSVLLKQIQDPLPEPEELKNLCNGDVMAVLKKMTEKSLEKRYLSYGELAAAITSLQPGTTHKGAHNITASMPVANTPSPEALPSDESIADDRYLAPVNRAVSPPPPVPSSIQTPSEPRTAVVSSREILESNAQNKSSGVKKAWLVPVLAAAGFLVFVILTAWYIIADHNKKNSSLRAITSASGMSEKAAPSTTPATPPLPSTTASTVTPPQPRSNAMQPINVSALVTPRPTPFPGVLSAITPVPKLADLVPSSGQLVLYNSTNPGEPVTLFNATGEAIGAVPSGTIVSLIRPATLNGGKWYVIRQSTGEVYVPVSQAKQAGSTESNRTVAPANAQAPAQAVYILGTQGAGPNEQVPTYLDNKGTNLYKSFPAGTEVSLISSTATMIRAKAPDGRVVYLHKKMVFEKP